MCLLITLTPGPDTAVVIQISLDSGRKAALRTACGCALGLFAHAAVVAFGLSGLLLGSAVAFHLLKLAGAVLLVLFGLKALHSAWRNNGKSSSSGSGRRRGKPLIQGLLTNLVNPKATLFFVASLPQFMPVHENTSGSTAPTALLLASVAVLFSLAGLSLVALAASRAARFVSSVRMRRVQQGLLGVTLVFLGIRVGAH
ncbi:LysE family translocator [Streptomyces sp. NPDC004787]|uniref:LysE family translocator n=1 Tax=Streptomyces sp. NPDC004787 TaxID=3154291 RepID=UPI0033A7F036